MLNKCFLLVSIFCVSQSHIFADQSSRECLQKAIAVIEIAAQQDAWYARFLKALLSQDNSTIADDCAREIILIAHMALTHAQNLNKPFPLPPKTQEDLINLFANACTGQDEFSGVKTSHTRCARCGGANASFPPVFNPGK